MAQRSSSNEPQRVIMRGKTRSMGERPRPREGSGTPAARAEPSTQARRIGTPARREDAQKGERFSQGERREAPAPRSPRAPESGPSSGTADERPAPRTHADERRPLDRIQALEDRSATTDAALSEVAEKTLILADRIEGDAVKLERLEALVLQLQAAVEAHVVVPGSEAPAPNAEAPASDTLPPGAEADQS